MNSLSDIIIQIELHSAAGIRQCFAAGANPNAIWRGEPLIYELTSEYSRSPRFKDCVQAFIDNGLDFKDKALLSVLCDDAAALELELAKTPESVSKKYSLRCAYTPLYEATLLHICAEFNHVACAEVLVRHGADVDARAGVDENGFGGQTPVFHTVNQNNNQSADMLQFLLSASANLHITVPGLVWGKGYDWETLIPAVNPVSYAMMGLLPQMHRDEITTSKTVATLLKHAYGINYAAQNIPCKYLES